MKNASIKELEADVIICGCGFAGLAAAVTARDGGASVLMFEKRPAPGGTSVFVEGLFAIGSRMQISRNIEITKEEAFQKHMDYSHWRANALLVREFIEKSADVIEWLEQMGVEFEKLISIFPNSPQVWHLFKGENKRSRGANVIKLLLEKAKEKDIQIYSETPVKELTVDKNNRIVGVVAEDKNGSTIRAKAKTVIISTGDFANNREMLKKHTKVGNADSLFNLGMTGDGIKMAWKVGAAPEGLETVLLAPGMPGQASSRLGRIARKPHLWINQHGERFCAEDIYYPYVNALLNQPNGIMYVVMDEATKRDVADKGLPAASGELIPEPIAPADLDADFDHAINAGNAFKADTLKELGERISLNSNLFQSNVDKYNRCCQQHFDDLFFKNPRHLHSITEPPFYAIKASVHVINSMGGIKINHKTEVLNKSHAVIPGLYAVGNCAGGLYGDTYDIHNTTGGASAFAINSGRIAGENALAYIGALEF